MYPRRAVEEVSHGDQAVVQEAQASCNVIIPEDGFLWRKSGQKFIKNIGRNRSYFKCQNRDCPVKKRVEWSGVEAGSYLRITYEGVHNHPPPEHPSSAIPSASQDYMGSEYN